MEAGGSRMANRISAFLDINLRNFRLLRLVSALSLFGTWGRGGPRGEQRDQQEVTAANRLSCRSTAREGCQIPIQCQTPGNRRTESHGSLLCSGGDGRTAGNV